LKKIVQFLIDFIKKDFNAGYYITVILILGGGIAFNYGFQFKKTQLDAYYGTTEQFFRFLLFFSATYFLILFVQAAWKKDFSAFKNKAYLIKITVALIILAFDSSSRHIFQWLTEHFEIPFEMRRWIFYLFTSIHQFINLGILIAILKLVFDKYDDSIYGLTLKNFDVKPYLDIGKFRELKNEKLFKSVKVSFDTIEWANQLDLDPELLYEKSYDKSKNPVE